MPQIAVLIDHGNACGAATGSTDNVINLAIQANYRAAMGSFLVTNVAITEPVAYKLRQWLPANRPLSGIAAPVIDPQGAVYFERKSRPATCWRTRRWPSLAAKARPYAHLSHHPGRQADPDAQHARAEVPELLVAGPHRRHVPGLGRLRLQRLQWHRHRQGPALIANAVGQQDRVAACELAVLQVRAAKRTADLKGAAVVSDSFFPFADGLDYLARRKVGAIFATSGSVNDKEVAEHAAQFPDLIFYTSRQGRPHVSGH